MREAAPKCPTGIPPWVMTFADLMSLLLAFFVLMFSFSEMDKNVYKELAGSLKEAFGVQREIKAKEAPKGINIIAREFSPGRPSPTPYDEVRQSTTDDYHMHPVFTDPAEDGQESRDEKADDPEDGLSVGQGGKAGSLENKSYSGDDDSILSHGEAIRKALQDEIMEGLIDLDIEDKRIILRIREKGSFPSGSADLIEPFKVITGRISEVFSDFDGMIVVSGHTDNIPIHTDRFRSNWELSSSRAVSVIHELSKNKLLMKKRFQVAAYADTQPVDTNDTAYGRARNRRVEITLDYRNIPDEIIEANSEALKKAGDSSGGMNSNHLKPVDNRAEAGEK